MNTLPRPSRFVHAPDERRIRVSFEFFPPKTEEMERTLWESITRLAPLRPYFVSVTYGAGGSTRERTHSTVKRILTETALIPAAHLTCVAATCDEIDSVIRDYCTAGVRHIVALRGDPIGGIGERYAPHPGGYRNGADLVAGIKRLTDVEVSVSAYPEKHPDRPAPPARSRSSSSRTTSTSPISTAFAHAASTCRSCREFSRCRISSRPRALPRVVAPRCRIGLPNGSKDSTMMWRHANSSLLPSRLSRFSISWTAASLPFTSTQ